MRKYNLSLLQSELMNATLLPNCPFVRKGWRAHLFESASHFTMEDYSILTSAIRYSGYDDKLFVLNYELYSTDLPEKEGIPVEWELGLGWSEFDNKVQSAPLYTLGIYIWGPSYTWGVICTHYDYLIIGGEDSFIKLVEEKYGGYEKIRDQFISYFKEGGPNIKKEWGERLIKSFYPEAE